MAPADGAAGNASFATVDDYVRRYGPVADEGLLSEVLVDASALIAAEVKAAGLDVSNPDAELASALMSVCRRVANRAMEEPAVESAAIPAGVSQYSHGIGDFTRSWTLSNPAREMYLTKTDRMLLGIRKRSRLMFCMPYSDAEEA